MRVMRVILLMLPLALFLSTAASAADNASIQTSPSLEELEAAIFSIDPDQNVDQAFVRGYCAFTCEPCLGSCPPLGGRYQPCAFACN